MIFEIALRFREAYVSPGFAAVGGAIDTVANGNAVARPGFAGTYPDVLMIGRVDRNGADRLHRLVIKHRLEGGGAVGGLPDAATGRAHKQVDFAGGIAEARQRRDPAAHGG